MKNYPHFSLPREIFTYYYQEFGKFLGVSLRKLVKDPFGRQRARDYRRLLELKGSRKGRIAFVLANGPSLTRISVPKFKKFVEDNNAEVFCINMFVNSDFARAVEPDYWVISDPYNFVENDDYVRQTNENGVKIVRKAIFCANQHLRKFRQKTDLEMIPFCDTETSHVFSNNIDPTKERSYLSMTAYKALAVAGYMEYDRIYIAGYDNSYIRLLGCDEENRIYRLEHHFDYKSYPSDSTRQFLDFKNRKVADELLANVRLFTDFYKFRKLPIFNLDTESLTDAFPKTKSLDIYLPEPITNVNHGS